MKQFVEFVFDDSLGHAHVNFITKFFDRGIDPKQRCERDDNSQMKQRQKQQQS